MQGLLMEGGVRMERRTGIATGMRGPGIVMATETETEAEAEIDTETGAERGTRPTGVEVIAETAGGVVGTRTGEGMKEEVWY